MRSLPTLAALSLLALASGLGCSAPEVDPSPPPAPRDTVWVTSSPANPVGPAGHEAHTASQSPVPSSLPIRLAPRAVPATVAAHSPNPPTTPHSPKTADAPAPAAAKPVVALPATAVANAVPESLVPTVFASKGKRSLRTTRVRPPAAGDGANDGGTATEPEAIEVVGAVVRGDPEYARNVATVDVERCFDLIPSYRKVKLEARSRESARYLLLIAQANEEFRTAVDWIALREGFDLVVERNGVRGTLTVDITDIVCDRLREASSRSTR
jgi:hypothetical protein